jgi:nucleoside-diphosphate-sugar epimerase
MPWRSKFYPPLAGVAQSAGGGFTIHDSPFTLDANPSNPSRVANASGLANPSNPSKASKPSICVAPLFAPARKGDVKHSLADISLAREMLNYKVEVDFTAGIKRTVEWYLKLK